MTVTTLPFIDLEPRTRTLLDDVLDGLGQDVKCLPCKYFYDEQGSHLFDEICELDEYYPTRTELAIMDDHVDEMAACLGPRCLLIEFGSGSGRKTEVLLESLDDPVGYVPIDISREHLIASAERLDERFPDLEVLPVCADYTSDYEIPEPARPARRRAIYFPGSTIGNFRHHEAVDFLARAAHACGRGGALLIGADLVKDPAILERAYNDAKGVTAAFNLNLLARINRELDADFDLDAFRHRAIWNEEEARIEMYLESVAEQTVAIDGRNFHFAAGETILTEHSHKYTLPSFARLAAGAGFEVERVWTDQDDLFSVQYLRAS